MEPALSNKQLEFVELANAIRHWERMRWVSMTVFIATTAALINARFGVVGQPISLPATVSNFAGALITLIFVVQDERIVTYWKSFMARARNVEVVLEIAVFSNTPRRGFLSAGNAVRILYGAFASFWLWMLVKDGFLGA